MKIQIYAFTIPEEAAAAAEMGVDHIGFVAGRYDLVPGELSFTEARTLCDALPAQTTRVALTMISDLEEILRMVDAVQPDIVHISSDVEDVPEKAMEELRKRLDSKVQLMKALPVGGAESLELARRFAPFSNLFLLDTKVTGMPGVGATGRTHDWSISRRIVEQFGVPVILAGGLSAENVTESIRQVGPWAVDSNTATNIPGDPVKKDLRRVAEFVAAVRALEEG
jgi:phosphoribosylanthranilate isomerase